MNGAATQIFSRQFDDDFFSLPPAVRERVQRRIDDMGSRLASFPHFRMTGADKCRLRVGDYRVIYRFDAARSEVFLVAIGHRREVYRDKT